MIAFVRYLLFFILLFLSQFTISQTVLDEKALTEDFDVFQKALEEIHPGLYRYTEKEDFDTLFSNARLRLSEVHSQEDFYRLLTPLIDAIHCGHTKIHPEEAMGHRLYFNKEHVFPLKLHFEGDKAFVVGSYTESQLPLGAEVRTINGQTIAQLLERLLPFFVSDGRNKTLKYSELNMFFSEAYANMVEGPISFSIDYTYQGQKHSASIPSISGTVLQQQQQKEASLKGVHAPYSFHINDSNVGVLRIASFWEEDPRVSFKRFLKSSFKELKAKGIEKLIIDVRDNEGGIDRRGALLLSYLMGEPFSYYDRLEVASNKKADLGVHAAYPKFYGLKRLFISQEGGRYFWKGNKNLKEQKPQEDHFDGEVYILTNGRSFSVTAEFAAMAHHLKRATFIGEETGGGYYGNNSGSFVLATLPNSKLTLGIPMMAYYMKVSDYPCTDSGVVPDYPVSQTLEAILNHQDLVMEFALQKTKE